MLSQKYVRISKHTQIRQIQTSQIRLAIINTTQSGYGSYHTFQSAVSITAWVFTVAVYLSILSPVPAELTLWTATWLHAPGADPQSTTLYPGCNTLNLSSISSSLKALLQRRFCAWVALTYGSLSCRASQRCSAGVLPFNFFIKHKDEWTRLLCTETNHIVVYWTVMCPMPECACAKKTSHV